LIEDQQTDNRRAIEQLKLAGYEVIPAFGPEGAASQLEENPDIDLIILDSIMEPGCYSLDETRQGTLTGLVLYKRLLERTGIPVAVWSVLGAAFDPPKTSGMEGWGESVILKSRKRMDQDALVDLVARCEEILTRKRRAS
jgi:CheY-like chemotaxis protein